MDIIKQVPELKENLKVSIEIDYRLAVAFPLALAELLKGKTNEDRTELVAKAKSGEELSGWQYSVLQLNVIYKNIVEAAKKEGQVTFTDFDPNSLLSGITS